MSLLSKKQRSANPYAQVQTLVRIATRATSKADWITGPTFDYLSATEKAENAEEARRLRDRAAAATTEMATTVVEHPECDWTLPQRRAAERWVREAS